MRRGIVLLLVVASVLLAGCYGRSSSSSTGTGTGTGTRISIDDFVAAIVAILQMLASIVLGCFVDVGITTFPLTGAEGFNFTVCILNNLTSFSVNL